MRVAPRWPSLALLAVAPGIAPAPALGEGPSSPCAATPCSVDSGTSGPVATAPAPVSEGEAPWSTRGARTLRKGRWELALVGTSRYGLADGVELEVQPFVFFILPHAAARLRVLERGPLSLALAPRVSYPSPFLSLVSREGAGGLLPDTTDVPFAIQLELEAIGSIRFGGDHVASAHLGGAVAPHARSGDLPLLDFPFLYPRFAALYTSVVPRLALGLEGPIVASVHYAVSVTAFLLPLDSVDGYAIEPAAELEHRFGAHLALSAGLRTSVARYPVGTRFHYLPFVDARVGF